MRRYKGIKIDENDQIIGWASFVVFGEMCDGSKCYYELDDDGNEKTGCWYFRIKRGGYNVFIFGGV